MLFWKLQWRVLSAWILPICNVQDEQMLQNPSILNYEWNFELKENLRELQTIHYKRKGSINVNVFILLNIQYIWGEDFSIDNLLP